MMLDKATAEAFANDWIACWNSHDLDQILHHYAEDFEFSSPFIIQIACEPSGVLKGKSAVRAYWAKALTRIPDLQFRLESVLWGINSLVINYRRHDGRTVSEWFEFGSNGKVVKSSAHYTA